MKYSRYKFVLLLIFFVFTTFIFAQDLKEVSESDLKEMKSEAIENKNFELVKEITLELDTRKSISKLIDEKENKIQKAVEDENFELAADLKNEIERLENIKEKVNQLEVNLDQAIKSEEYNKAEEINSEIKNLKLIALQPEQNVAEKEENIVEDNENTINLSTTQTSVGFVAPKEGNAAVYIVQYQNVGLLVGFKYFHENQYIGEFKGKDYLRFECKAGKHLFWTASHNIDELTADLKEGEIYIIQVLQVPGAVKSSVYLQPLTLSDERQISKSAKIITNRPATVMSKKDLVEENIKMKNYLEEKSSHLQSLVNEGKVKKHIALDDFIPLEQLEKY